MRITHSDLERVFTNHIDTRSIICSDSHKSYIQFAKDLSLEHKQIPYGLHKSGIYHINRVNSLHSRFKQWLSDFEGVSGFADVRISNFRIRSRTLNKYT